VRLTRVYVDAALSPGSTVELPADTASHVAKVLRARAGDELVLFNGDGREFAGAIDQVRGSRVAASVGNGRTVDRESPLRITLVQCVPRGDRMDLIVQKATELGVARIVPVLSQRSVVRLDKSQAESKATHWRAVAVSACEQSGRNRLPVIEAAQPLLRHLGDRVAGSEARWVFEPQSLGPVQSPTGTDNPAGSETLARAGLPAGTDNPAGADTPARADKRAGADDPAGAAAPAASAAEIAIGPEGGFADDELEAFRVAGFIQVGLGPRILRTETAAIAALVWLQSRCGDMGFG